MRNPPPGLAISARVLPATRPSAASASTARSHCSRASSRAAGSAVSSGASSVDASNTSRWFGRPKRAAGSAVFNRATYAGSGKARSALPSSSRPVSAQPIRHRPTSSASSTASRAGPKSAASSITSAAVLPSRVTRSERAPVIIGAKRAASAMASPSVEAAIAAKPR